MLKDKLEKVKNELTKTDNKNSKKKIENIVIGILILLITVIAINAILSDKDEEETVVNEIENNNVNFQASNTDLETRLENILSKIEEVTFMANRENPKGSLLYTVCIPKALNRVPSKLSTVQPRNVPTEFG